MLSQDPHLVAWYYLPAKLGIAVLLGIVYFLALPPCNISMLVLFPLGGVWLLLKNLRFKEQLLAGWCFGMGWAMPAFWFLREIHPGVPFGIAPVLALWPAVWAAGAVFLSNHLLYPVKVRLEGEEAVRGYLPAPWKRILTAMVLAAFWILLEFSRSTMLPWNNFATAAWRHPRILALAAWTGTAGIGFLIANFSLALALARQFRRDRLSLPFWLGGVLPLAVLPLLAWHFRQTPDQKDTVSFRIAAIQGDISQRRNADEREAVEALQVYLGLTRQAMKLQPAPDLIVWPETAVPYAFRGSHPVSAGFRSELSRLVRESRIPVLFGTIEFKEKFDRPGEYGITNSALLLTPYGLAGRYDKIHRVPFGEYIPFRKILPGALVRAIDMNRDLTPGTDHAPLVLKENIRAGMAICFESVFPYIARETARRGSNVLLVLSNDAWYPASSEPEQHLANATARSVETGLYAIRCGNNGGTLAVRPDGTLEQILTVPGRELPELRRGRGIGVIALALPKITRMTFYTCYGEWFTALCGLLSGAGFLLALAGYIALRREIRNRLEDTCNGQTRIREKGRTE